MRLHLTTADRERFESKIYYIPGGCWIWLASLRVNQVNRGYGSFSVAGCNMLAHRVAWLLYRGPIPPETPQVLHNCPGGDWPGCVNPDHLWLGTVQDNHLDKARKGRGRKGKLPFGVRRERSGRFTAQVRIMGQMRSFGTHDTINLAHEIAMAAAQERYS